MPDEVQETPSPAAQLVEEFDDAFAAPPEKPAEEKPADGPRLNKAGRPIDEKGHFLPTKSAEVPVTTPKYTHSKMLTRQALEMGISESDIAETPPEDLRLYVQQQENARFLQRQREVPQARNETPDPLEGLDWGKDEDGKPLSPTDLHPSIVNVVKQLRAEISQLRQWANGESREKYVNKAERAFAADADVFGEGLIDDLDPNGRFMALRNEAARRVNADTGPGSFESKMKKIAEAFRGGPRGHTKTPGQEPKPEKPAPNGHSRITHEQWNRGGVLPPTEREGKPEPAGIRKAKQEFAKGMAELRQAHGDSEDDNVF